ncbi:MAG TPA: alpha/beta hydrolase [Rhizomicrobium sp.]|jgi:acetyl esterase/lipase|nr:alpha/beta hydrolase [Rhizomicrobium sp.]
MSLLTTLFNATIPRTGYRIVRDVAYGAEARQRMDIYVPKGLSGPAPVVLFFYGGSWKTGTKAIYRFLGQALASKGIVTAVADYRLYPQVKYPAFVHDSAEAFRYLRAHAAAYGGDRDRIFLAGHSAGAYNVALLAADRRYLSDNERAAIRGVIGIAGPYDFLPLQDPDLIDMFGGDSVAETQPIRHVDRKLPPMLLAHGSGDTTVHPRNVRRMTKKLEEFGTEVVKREYDGIGHIEIIVSLAPWFRGRTTLREDIVQFVWSH